MLSLCRPCCQASITFQLRSCFLFQIRYRRFWFRCVCFFVSFLVSQRSSERDSGEMKGQTYLSLVAVSFAHACLCLDGCGEFLFGDLFFFFFFRNFSAGAFNSGAVQTLTAYQESSEVPRNFVPVFWNSERIEGRALRSVVFLLTFLQRAFLPLYDHVG